MNQDSKRVLGTAFERKLLTAALLLLYIVGLHFVYRAILSPIYKYEGLTYRTPLPTDYALVIIGMIVVGLVLPLRIDRASAFIQWAMYLVAAVPTAIIPQFSLTLTQHEANQLAAIVCLSVLSIRILTANNPFLGFAGINLPSGYVEVVIVAVTLFVNFYVIAFVGLNVRFLTFADANDVALRQGYEAASTALPLMGYLLATQFNVLNPVMVFAGLQQRRYLLLFIGLTSQAVCYLTTGQKHMVLLLLVILALHLGVRQREWIQARTIIVTLIIMSFMSALVDSWSGSPTFTALFIRRFLVVPGMLAGAYVSVFHDKPKGLFHDVLGSAVGGSQNSAALTVGREFLNSSVASANANMFGHGYYSYGFIGILIEAVFVVFMLWAADAATFGKMQVSAACALFAGPTSALTNTSPFTTLITHGFLTAVVLGTVYNPGRVRMGPSDIDRDSDVLGDPASRLSSAGPRTSQHRRATLS